MNKLSKPFKPSDKYIENLEKGMQAMERIALWDEILRMLLMKSRIKNG